MKSISYHGGASKTRKIVAVKPFISITFLLALLSCDRFTSFGYENYDDSDSLDRKRYALCNEHYESESELASISAGCESENRMCLVQLSNTDNNSNSSNSISSDETIVCGPCSRGYVALGKYLNGGKEICVKIDSLEWTKFSDEYNPIYSQRGDLIPNEKRLQALKEAARFIVDSNNLNMNVKANSSSDGDIDVDIDISFDFVLGLTPYSADYTEEDYRSRSGYVYQNLTGTNEELKPFNVSEYSYDNINASRRSLQGLFNGGVGADSTSTDFNTVPPSVDWVELGGVTHVKDQGRCGCCWAISLAGAIEGGVYSDPTNFKYLQSLSFQQFISCSKSNGGCDGGNLALASLYAQLGLFKGITRLNDYPYTDFFGSTTEECLAPANIFSGSSSTSDKEMPLAVQVNDARRVAGFDARLTHNERVRAFKEALAIKPIAMVMKSQCKTFSNYNKGVMTNDGDCACDRVDCVDHAILMVGYDDTAEIPYFKMKNSWGTQWGENGYFRVAQSPGLGTYGLFGILAEGVVASGRNTTMVVEDKIQMSPIRQWWAILLITIGCIVMTGVFYAIFRKYFCKPEDDEK